MRTELTTGLRTSSCTQARGITCESTIPRLQRTSGRVRRTSDEIPALTQVLLSDPGWVRNHMDTPQSASVAGCTQHEHISFAVQPLPKVFVIGGDHGWELGDDLGRINRVAQAPLDHPVVRFHVLTIGELALSDVT